MKIFFALKSTLSNINIPFYPFIFQIAMPLLSFLGFPGGSGTKESTCLVKTWIQSLAWEDPLEEDLGIWILAWRIPWTENPVGYSPWGQKESDITWQLNHHLVFLHIYS